MPVPYKSANRRWRVENMLGATLLLALILNGQFFLLIPHMLNIYKNLVSKLPEITAGIIAFPT